MERHVVKPLIGGLSVVVLSASFLVGAASLQASALAPRSVGVTTPQPIDPYAATACESVGTTTYSFTTSSKVETVTRIGRFTNSSTVTQAQTISEGLVVTLSESTTGTFSGTVTVSGIIAKASATVGITLASENSTTGSVSKTTSVTAPAGATMIVAEGTMKVTGTWSASYCQSLTSAVTSSGTLTDYGSVLETVIYQCGTSPAGALATLAKGYC